MSTWDPYRESDAQKIRRLSTNLLEASQQLTHAWRNQRGYAPGIHMQLVNLERRAQDLTQALNEQLRVQGVPDQEEEKPRLRSSGLNLPRDPEE